MVESTTRTRSSMRGWGSGGPGYQLVRKDHFTQYSSHSISPYEVLLDGDNPIIAPVSKHLIYTFSTPSHDKVPDTVSISQTRFLAAQVFRFPSVELSVYFCQVFPSLSRTVYKMQPAPSF
ncbi:hypothetical protein AMTRI_Chr06g177550 [Amborella trichopoda]